MNDDTKYMLRALQLAKLGLGTVSPNPMVGCVIVHENKIIGEGFHQKYGGPHAEVFAINSVKNTELLSKSTLYVTLEPCSHFGKTPPCADLIVGHKIPNVVVCNVDPNPLVAGKGILKLLQAGVNVKSNICTELGHELNKRFFSFYSKKRPYVFLKWAQTKDNFLAKQNFDSKWISNQYARQVVHQVRANEDAILVGFNTAFYDNPTLTVREIAGKNPLRILIDKNLQIPNNFAIFNTDSKTIVVNKILTQSSENIEYIQSDCSVSTILDILYSKQIQSLVVEGGSATLQNFIAANLWDEAWVFESKTCFEKGIKSPKITYVSDSEKNILGNKLTIYKNKLA